MVARSYQSQLALQQQFHDYLCQALAALGATVSDADCECIATAVQQSMVGPWRFFHTLEHGMKVGGSKEPIEMLAGAFHDVVYVQVDAGIPFNLTDCISPVVEQVGETMRLRAVQPETRYLRWLLPLFGLSVGQALLPRAGQNEFLSALVAMKLLEPFLEVPVLMAIALCIEATIPFRKGPSPEGLSEAMLLRLQGICREQGLAISAAEQIAMVRRAVRVGNRDVMSFAEASAAHFLADTWNLLPESHQFSPGGLHRIQDYRQVIEQTERFFLHLDPSCIFQQFRGEPSLEIKAQWENQARENLAVGTLYLSCKLVAIALLEALASPFGPQTALSLFMGTLPDANASQPLRLEQFFPPPQWSGEAMSDREAQVWELLSEGRAASSHQGDVLYSPLATFVTQFHGFAPLPQQLEAARAWLSGDLSCDQFLQHFESTFLELFFESIHRLWEQRQIAFDAYFRPQAEMPVQVSSGGLAINLATRRQ